jgi:diacylglycerol kinase (ATP)
VESGVMREGVRPAGPQRLWLATQNSLRGLKHCYSSEAAFRQEVWASVLLVPAGLWLGETGVERVLLVGSVLFVMIVELLNTAVEVVVDRIGVERHHLSGFAKDLGSSAVLFSLVLVVLTWSLVLWDRASSTFFTR